jgi:hypothetical protein
MLVTGWFGASAVQATDLASPIGFWKGQDGTFEMFESEGKLSARIVALNEPKTAEGKEKTDIYNPGVYWNCIDGPKLHLDQSELRYATAFPHSLFCQSSYSEATVILREGYRRNSAIRARIIMPDK